MFLALPGSAFSTHLFVHSPGNSSRQRGGSQAYVEHFEGCACAVGSNDDRPRQGLRAERAFDKLHTLIHEPSLDLT